ncbi:ATP-dependent metallopeptidase FtsH/Yme1/Tma family protein [Rhizobium sp. P28RR-XV]|uniref:ATP-dependent metallopeptidase FtsH/Yme1/Tma family protein n=1 Tax=Rhizobium sp. P28RR-XV TaxID=2726737 RepID=UPI0014578FB3|nr:hypothetical protein [Rhizobium sp. P28RR-XV]
MERKHKFNIEYVLMAFLLIGLLQFWLAARNVEEIAYSDLMRMVAEGKIQSVTLTETMIEGVFKQPRAGKSEFISNRVDPLAAA